MVKIESVSQEMAPCEEVVEYIQKRRKKGREFASALTPRSAPHAARTHPQDEQGR